MKQLLLLVLFPFSLFAQTFYPDTISMQYGKTFPCFVTNINDYSVNIIYQNFRQETAVLEGINYLSIENYGTVYKSETGFKINKDILGKYLSLRNDDLKKRGAKDDPELITALAEQKKNERKEVTEYVNEFQKDTINRWSFGMLYIPYSSGKVYYSDDDPISPDVYSIANSEINMEAQFAYNVFKSFFFTLNLGYTSAYTEEKIDRHNRTLLQDPPMVFDRMSKTTDGIKLLNVIIGGKYQFTRIIGQKVSAFVLLGIGKQFAFVEQSYESSETPNPNYNHQDNTKEFNEDINSPWQLNIGFGAEYFFNESLSIFSNIRVLCSAFEGKYESRTVSSFEVSSYSYNYKKSNAITRVGLGLNFYF